MEKKEALWRVVLALFLASSVAIAIWGDQKLLAPVSLLFLLVPPAAERLFRMRLGMPLRICTLLFCLLGFNLGTALRWYYLVPGYDKFVHLLSGIFFAQVGLCLYGRIGGDYDRRAKWLLQLTYAVCFAMAVAGLWEIFEYVGYLLTGHDAQHVADTGIHDTMQDIIACLLGSGVMALCYRRYVRTGKNSLMWPVQAFDAANTGSAGDAP